MKNKLAAIVQFRFRVFIWLNIGIQIFFPLAIAFTPLVVGAGSETRFLQSPAGKNILSTQVYKLSPGETTASVARHFNLSIDALRKLNRYRNFTHDFEQLQPGDELDVPVSPLPTLEWRDDKAIHTTPVQTDDEQRKLAGLLSRAGSFFSQRHQADAAASMGRSLATDQASGHLQQWLSQFGSARVRLDADKRFTLKNSQVDLLVPWYEHKDKLVFTQTSLHYTDQRTQYNLGVGLRHFDTDWMLGGNLFLDYDLSRNHARMGPGLEYWRDFLKLGANGYLHLSSWKQSKDVEDAVERPANGWDVRAEAWLPAWPQIGGTLAYEQYLGDDVALFDKDRRQQNPYVITAGISYTPFPLLTFRAEQRQGKNGENAINFSGQVRYQLGMPWRQQIDPDSVRAMRSLAGSRYDLIERNNNIILEYRNKDVINLSSAKLLIGYAGQQKSMEVSVNSQHGLAGINWSASELMAAGGKIVSEGEENFSLLFPEYHSNPEEVNTYIVSGVAVDKKGNRSRESRIQVTVVQGAINPENSTLSPSKVVLPADGKTQQQLVLKVNDLNGKPVDIAADEITIQQEKDTKDDSGSKLSAFSRRAAGEYVATLTAGKKTASFGVRPWARKMGLASAQVILTADDSTARIKGAIRVTPQSAMVGDTVTYHAALEDQYGNALGASIPLTWAANEGSQLSDPVTYSDDKGHVSVTLTRTLPGTAQVIAILPSGRVAAPDVKFAAGKPEESRSLLILSPSTIVAGKEQATLMLVLKDQYGNALSDQLVKGMSDNSDIRFGDTKEVSRGRYNISVMGSKAGIATLSVVVNGQAFSATKTLTVTGDASDWRISSVSPDKSRFAATDAQGVTYRAVVLDRLGNTLPGVVVSWHLKGVANDFPPTSRTDDKGVATTTVTSHVAGQLDMTAYLDPTNFLQALPVEVEPGDVDVAQSGFSADKGLISSDGKEAATLTVTLKDRYDNAISAKAVRIEKVSVQGGGTVSPVVALPNGIYQARVTSDAKGDIPLIAQVDEKKIGSMITLVAGATTPDLRFDNALQPITYARGTRFPQQVKGMPEGVEQRWSSTNPAVATTDPVTGAVTLLKSGETTITVYTPGNTQYNPALASYLLRVKKADPQLKTGEGTLIKAVWADGNRYHVTATFGNPDVEVGSLNPVYDSKDTTVATVLSDGKIQAIKPGSTTLTVHTPETEQFGAASVEVAYVLEKATRDLSFTTDIFKMTDQEKFTLQQPASSLPPDAKISWETSDKTVVDLSSNGQLIKPVSKGRTRLTLKVIANEYYHGSTGFYDVLVYTKPTISVGRLVYNSKGVEVTSGTWTPVFTTDTMTINWSVDASNEFSKPETVMVNLWDINTGKVVSQQTIDKPTGAKFTKFEPQTSTWGHTVKVEVIAKGYGTLSARQEMPNIDVRNLQPREIWEEAYITTQLLGQCQLIGTARVFMKDPKFGIRFPYAKTLLVDMHVTAMTERTAGIAGTYGLFTAQDGQAQGAMTVKNSFDWTGNTSVVDGDCWPDHYSTYVSLMEVNYAGKTYRYKSDNQHYWEGRNNVVRIGPFRDEMK